MCRPDPLDQIPAPRCVLQDALRALDQLAETDPLVGERAAWRASRTELKEWIERYDSVHTEDCDLSADEREGASQEERVLSRYEQMMRRVTGQAA